MPPLLPAIVARPTRAGVNGHATRCGMLRAPSAFTGLTLAALLSAVAQSQEEPVEVPNKSPRYVLNYPAVDGFCPPVRSYFEDVAQAVQEIDGRTVQHQLDGGYGLAIRAKVAGKNLLHLGADVAWYRAGDPVFAIANGVVRTSAGPANDPKDAPRVDIPKGAQRGPEAKHPVGSAALQWGNLITIEHRSSDGKYVTSIYGHLAQQRLVSVGDVVKAGQIIGVVGKPGIENGGYKAHLHFAILEGRMAEPGAELFKSPWGGRQTPVTLVSLNEQEVEVKADEALPSQATINANGHSYTMTTHDGKHWLSADVLNYLHRPDFQIVGYALSTKGWRDPTEFLRQMQADVNPAKFQLTPPSRKKKEVRQARGSSASRVEKSTPSASPAAMRVRPDAPVPKSPAHLPPDPNDAKPG